MAHQASATGTYSKLANLKNAEVNFYCDENEVPKLSDPEKYCQKTGTKAYPLVPADGRKTWSIIICGDYWQKKLGESEKTANRARTPSGRTTQMDGISLVNGVPLDALLEKWFSAVVAREILHVGLGDCMTSPYT